jgi:hypothetical protein
MKVGIMQPYFMPYLGYFQLLNLVDRFVIYDNIEYTKKGWINRNRIILNGEISTISIPLKKGSDFLNINERYLAENWDREKIKLINKLRQAYIKAPNYSVFFPIIEEILNEENKNLFEFIFNSIIKIKEFLEIKTEIIVSSHLKVNHDLKSQDKVLEICNNLGAKSYYNSIGGENLYFKESFDKENIDLNFIKVNDIKYNHSNSHLSIIDVIMHNSRSELNDLLNQFSMIKP